MQLQKFVGDSMPVVLNSLKDALGSDAIILANRRVGDHIEIIATGTLDEASIDNAELFQASNDSASTTENNIDASPTEIENAMSGDMVSSVESSVDDGVTNNVNNVVDNAVDNAVDNGENTPPEEPADLIEINEQPANAVITNETPVAEESELLETVSILHEQTLERIREAEAEVVSTIASAVEGNTDSMTKSIAHEVNLEVGGSLESFHTTMTQRLSQLETNLWGEKDPIKSKHLQTLLEIGLGAELAVALVNRVNGPATFDEALRQSLSDLSNTLPIASDRTLTHKGVTFVYGPNGSGKTTSLLKLAAQKVAESGSDSVVIICADANRTGVVESLTAHGKSLGVSVVSANTRQELEQSLSIYANKELVLVDQHSNHEFISVDIPEVLSAGQKVIDAKDSSVRHLLVLPATIQSSVAEAVVAEFSKHASARCVITNLDRPCRVGELFTTIIRNNLRVSYWSECGDIHSPLNKASATTLVATAMAMGKRLVPSQDDRYLMDLIHPRFSASVLPMFRANQ